MIIYIYINFSILKKNQLFKIDTKYKKNLRETFIKIFFKYPWRNKKWNYYGFMLL